MSSDVREYSLDVSEYLFRLTTESLRLHSNETQRFQTLASLVDTIAAAGSSAPDQHDLATLRNHLRTIPTDGPIRIRLSISKTSADSLMEVKQRLARQLGSCVSIGDALSVILFDYVVERNAARVLNKLGIETQATESDQSDTGKVVPLR